ncbi:hypothetical protein JTB14_037955 [Gonioctena quinquepunctata]|nr:hypothetical protein JTB14_037955 [Gonioctena quinquepunctata]
MGDIKVETDSDGIYRQYFPNTTGFLKFKVKATNNANISLSKLPFVKENDYTFVIGGEKNTNTVLNEKGTPELVKTQTKNILDANGFCGFWINWQGKFICLGKENDMTPFLCHEHVEPLDFQYFSISTAYGSTGSWIIERPRLVMGEGHFSKI